MSNILVREYLDSHGITYEKAKAAGLYIDTSVRAIVIPIKDTQGTVIFNKKRLLVGDVKYLYDRGAKVSLYGANRIPESDTIVVTEGEIDAISISGEMIGDNITVIGVSSTGGAMSWQDDFNTYLAGKHVIVAFDRDKAGVDGAFKTWVSLVKSEAKSVSLGVVSAQCGKDVSDMVVRGGKLIIITPPKVLAVGCGGSKKEIKESIVAGIEFFSHPLGSDVYYLTEVFKMKLIEQLRLLDRESKKKVAHEDFHNLKDIPITNFVDFSYGKAHCLFHKDTHPSMTYNPPASQFPNTVKCFACGKFGSVFDVVMAQRECTFKEAVEYLKTL